MPTAPRRRDRPTEAAVLPLWVGAPRDEANPSLVGLVHELRIVVGLELGRS
jgi:hypothetical protein